MTADVDLSKSNYVASYKIPKDNYKIMGLLIDFFPVLEGFGRYQINKVPFCHICSVVIS